MNTTILVSEELFEDVRLNENIMRAIYSSILRKQNESMQILLYEMEYGEGSHQELIYGGAPGL